MNVINTLKCMIQKKLFDIYKQIFETILMTIYFGMSLYLQFYMLIESIKISIWVSLLIVLSMLGNLILIDKIQKLMQSLEKYENEKRLSE